MDNSNILQAIEANRTPLSKMMDLSIHSDGSVIRLREKHFCRLLTIVTAYILIPFSILFTYTAYSLGYWIFVAVFPFVLVWSIYVVRVQTRAVEINLVKKTVSTIGRWQKSRTFSWEGYLGTETVYSVMDFPEEFYIKFMNEEKAYKVKLADVNSLFRKSTETNYQALLTFWECVEKKMVEAKNECIRLEENL